MSVFSHTLSSDGIHIHSVMVKMYRTHLHSYSGGGSRSQSHSVAVEDLRSQVLSQSVTLYFHSQTNRGLVAKIKETTSTSFSNINLFLAQQSHMLFSVGFCLFLWSIKISKIPLFLCLRSHCFSWYSKRSTWKVESVYIWSPGNVRERSAFPPNRNKEVWGEWDLTYSLIADVKRQMWKLFPGVIFWIPHNGTLGTTPTFIE